MKKVKFSKRSWWMICFAIFLTGFLALFLYIVLPSNKDASIGENTSHISNVIQNSANNQQFNASVCMTTADGKLYFAPGNTIDTVDETKYRNWLCVFENGSIKRIKSFNGKYVLTAKDGYIYYTPLNWNLTFLSGNTVHCYNIMTAEDHKLCHGQMIDRDHTYISNDGSIYFRDCYADEYVFHHVEDAQYYGEKVITEQYHLNGKSYYIRDLFNYDMIVCRDENGNEAELEGLGYGPKSIIPCSNGLLVHNEEHGDLLYYICGETGEIKELFATECMYSVSAVNVYENSVFLSFMRYEKHGEKGMVRFENDAEEGTYCIDLMDFSVTKLSDEIYNGLYIFDNTGIYACDDKANIFKLDFNGTRIDTLFEVHD